MTPQIYHFELTLDQVNKIVACMTNGPFGQVNEVLAEFRRQMEPQNKPEAPPAPPQAPASPPNGNGESAITR